MAPRFGSVFFLLLLMVASAISTYVPFDDDLLDTDCLETGQCSAAGPGPADGLNISSDNDTRRSLRGRPRFISYGALAKNNVPCSRRGHSYYNCGSSKRANPYRRGCSAITRCARAIS